MVIARLLPRGYLFTVLGIAVGMAGLVALGGMAERITRFIEGGDRFVLGQISVAGQGLGMGAGFTGGGLLPREKLQEILAVPGVAAVQAQVMLPLNPVTSQFLTLTQELILGLDLSVPMPNRHYRELPVRAGRFLGSGDRREVVVGADFAAARGLGPGSRLALDGRDFVVVGVLERTLTAPDRFAIVGIEAARDLWLAKDPLLRQVFGAGASLSLEDLNTGAAVGWVDGEDPDAVARRIAQRVAGVNITIPSEVSRLLRNSTAFFSAIIVGIGTLGLLIGALSLANTVTAALFERIRDFGIKRALGATDLQLLAEVLRESLVVSLAGGGAGIALALALGWGIHGWVARQGQQLFLFSPRLLAGAVVFSLVLGALAAAHATFRIARVPPAEAIRRGS
ncbi:MAG: ABC transporter permease [Candidatus Rokuibacteriota bacterium]